MIILRPYTNSNRALDKVTLFEVHTLENNNGDFHFVDLIIRELKSHMTCQNSIPIVG